MAALKVLAFIVGVLAVAGGSVLFILCLMFGAGGIMDRYRRDRASEAVFAAIAVIGVVLLAWASHT